MGELIDSGLFDEAVGDSMSVPPHIAWTTDGNQVVLADLRSGARTTLTTTASLIWELTVKGASRNEIVRELRGAFPDAPPDLAREVDGLVDSLIDEGLLERSPG